MLAEYSCGIAGTETTEIQSSSLWVRTVNPDHQTKENKMKKFLASAATAFLIAGGLTIGAASAANAVEVCVPSDAWTEVVADIEHPAVTTLVEHPAVYETVVVTPAVPEVAEVKLTEYQWKWWGIKDHGVLVWSAEKPADPLNEWGGYGWLKTDKQRSTVIVAYKPAVPEVTEQRLVTEAWTETVVVTEAWTEVVPDIDHPAVECPPVGPVPANPGAYFASSCGEASLTLTNSYDNVLESLTASFVVNVDGQFYDAYAVATNQTQTIGFSFSEDSGTHLIEVFQSGTSEWAKIASLEVESDCEEEPAPPVVEPPVVVPPVVTPPVVQTPVVEAPEAVTPVVDAQVLAETGADWSLFAWGVGAFVLLVIGGTFAYFGFFHGSRHIKD